MASATGTTTMFSERVQLYGADWCPDCRRAKAVLNRAGVAYDDFDLVEDVEATKRAEEISGQKHIPVVVFPDGVFYVEPTDKELGLKLAALELSA